MIHVKREKEKLTRIYSTIEVNTGILVSCLQLFPKFLDWQFPKGVFSFFRAILTFQRGDESRDSRNPSLTAALTFQNTKPYEIWDNRTHIELGSRENLQNMRSVVWYTDLLFQRQAWTPHVTTVMSFSLHYSFSLPAFWFRVFSIIITILYFFGEFKNTVMSKDEVQTISIVCLMRLWNIKITSILK